MVPSNLSPQSGRGYTLSSGAEESPRCQASITPFFHGKVRSFPQKIEAISLWEKHCFLGEKKVGIYLMLYLAGDSFSLLVTRAIFSLDFQSLANSTNELVPRAYCVLSNLMNTGRMKIV